MFAPTWMTMEENGGQRHVAGRRVQYGGRSLYMKHTYTHLVYQDDDIVIAHRVIRKEVLHEVPRVAGLACGS